jgi:hypothetical protein
MLRATFAEFILFSYLARDPSSNAVVELRSRVR